MNRKLIGILLMTPSFCWAINSGFYVGLGGGADTADFKQHSQVTSPGSFDVKQNGELAAQGAFGTIFAGYGYQKGQFYLAGELNGNVSSLSSSTSNKEIIHGTFSSSTNKIDRSWGLSAVPGILITENTLLYGRIGYESGHYVLSSSDISLARTSRMLSGLRFGLGLEEQVYKNIDLRFEYNHINYQDYTGKTFDPIGNVAKSTTVTPNTNQFEFSMIYRFI